MAKGAADAKGSGKTVVFRRHFQEPGLNIESPCLSVETPWNDTRTRWKLGPGLGPGEKRVPGLGARNAGDGAEIGGVGARNVSGKTRTGR